MKKAISIIFLSICLAACNNETEKQTGKFIDADEYEVSIKKSIEQYPDSLPLRDILIDYYHNNAKDSLAMIAADEALRMDSLNAHWWDLKARLYDQFDTVNIIKSWEKAVSLAPLPEYLTSLGYMYAHTTNARAVNIADLLLKSNKSNKEAFLIRGIYFSKTGGKQKAIAQFDEALKASYTFMFAYREKAIALYEMGKYAEAVEVLERALSVQSNYDEAYYWIGRNYEKLNKLNEARENYQLAIKAAGQANEDYPEAQDALDSVEVKLKAAGPR